MGADFPERGNGRGDANLQGCLFIILGFIVLVTWGVGLAMVVHGAYSKDLWEFIYGVAMVIVLTVLRWLTK